MLNTRSKKLSIGKRRLFDYLGEPYRSKIIDNENCVYLDMGNYDIEISGGRTKRSKIHIYVWKTKDGTEIVERHLDLRQDLLKIKKLLDDIRNRYSKEDNTESEEK